ncbi:MAG: mechanosensitive ion channel family protein [Solirubrobacterales bacterium]
MLFGQGNLPDPSGADTGKVEQVVSNGINAADGIRSAATFAAAVVASILLRRLVRRIAERSGATGTLARLFGRLAAYLIVVVGLVYALATLGVRVGPLLGALGIGGIALAFALQEILSNLIAGILLQLRRPFRRGDQIVTNEFEGTVQDINLRVTTLRNFDGETVLIPNSKVLQCPIINWTETPTRRTTLTVGVAYDTDLDRAQQVLQDALKDVESVADAPLPEAFVVEFGDSSINFAVRFWHRSEIAFMWRARDEAARALKRALDEQGIAIPFPQRTLWFGPGNESLRLDSDPGKPAG